MANGMQVFLSGFFQTVKPPLMDYSKAFGDFPDDNLISGYKADTSPFLSVVPSGPARPCGRRRRHWRRIFSRNLGWQIDFTLAHGGNGPSDLSSHILFRQDPGRTGRQSVDQVFGFLIKDHDQDLGFRVVQFDELSSFPGPEIGQG